MHIPKEFILLSLLLLLLLITAKPLGSYIFSVLENTSHPLKKVFGKLESLIYRFARIDVRRNCSWTRYAMDLMGLSLISFLVTYLVLRYQHILPLNPQSLAGLSPDLAWNTAMSFLTNTNWQAYTGEAVLSHFSQMVALTLQNFFSTAVGITAAMAVLRGFSSENVEGIGNFSVDFVRTILYILLPLSFIYALVLLSQGVIQSFGGPIAATSLEGASLLIPTGPVASQIAIKLLGTNGGGFFGTNAAHPFENPTPLINFIQIFSYLLIPSSLIYTMGKKVKNLRHAWSLWITMALLLVGSTYTALHFEKKGNIHLKNLGCEVTQNMEGKETRFGVVDSTLYAVTTTATSCGSANASHDSFNPMTGMILLFNILLGEIIFGGAGSGILNMMLFIVLTVFLSGLMIGRTPEYLGKKIESTEIKLATLAILITAFSILGFSAWTALATPALSSLPETGPHGLSRILYAFSSATANNGSAMAGFDMNKPYWNIFLGIAMFVGRFFTIIPILALAGSMSKKKIHHDPEHSFPVHGTLFIFLLISIIFVVGALTFFPALSLGPLAEHLNMIGPKRF
ncbi:MAG: potassium-transporting ATPase subunit KdpA [Bacteriovoracaceae bacterium]|nr:potassium-transporting ATPase subunit KdpA [Bacteriovoracaceae bacterium]